MNENINNKQKRDKNGRFLPTANSKRFSQLDVDMAVRDALIKANVQYNRLDDVSKAFKAGLNASGFWQSPAQKLATYLRDNDIK